MAQEQADFFLRFGSNAGDFATEIEGGVDRAFNKIGELSNAVENLNRQLRDSPARDLASAMQDEMRGIGKSIGDTLRAELKRELAGLGQEISKNLNITVEANVAEGRGGGARPSNATSTPDSVVREAAEQSRQVKASAEQLDAAFKRINSSADEVNAKLRGLPETVVRESKNAFARIAVELDQVMSRMKAESQSQPTRRGQQEVAASYLPRIEAITQRLINAAEGRPERPRDTSTDQRSSAIDDVAARRFEAAASEIDAAAVKFTSSVGRFEEAIAKLNEVGVQLNPEQIADAVARGSKQAETTREWRGARPPGRGREAERKATSAASTSTDLRLIEQTLQGLVVAGERGKRPPSSALTTLERNIRGALGPESVEAILEPLRGSAPDTEAALSEFRTRLIELSRATEDVSKSERAVEQENRKVVAEKQRKRDVVEASEAAVSPQPASPASVASTAQRNAEARIAAEERERARRQSRAPRDFAETQARLRSLDPVERTRAQKDAERLGISYDRDRALESLAKTVGVGQKNEMVGGVPELDVFKQLTEEQVRLARRDVAMRSGGRGIMDGIVIEMGDQVARAGIIGPESRGIGPSSAAQAQARLAMGYRLTDQRDAAQELERSLKFGRKDATISERQAELARAAGIEGVEVGQSTKATLETISPEVRRLEGELLKLKVALAEAAQGVQTTGEATSGVAGRGRETAQRDELELLKGYGSLTQDERASVRQFQEREAVRGLTEARFMEVMVSSGIETLPRQPGGREGVRLMAEPGEDPRLFAQKMQENFSILRGAELQTQAASASVAVQTLTQFPDAGIDSFITDSKDATTRAIMSGARDMVERYDQAIINRYRDPEDPRNILTDKADEAGEGDVLRGAMRRMEQIEEAEATITRRAETIAQRNEEIISQLKSRIGQERGIPAEQVSLTTEQLTAAGVSFQGDERARRLMNRGGLQAMSYAAVRPDTGEQVSLDPFYRAGSRDDAQRAFFERQKAAGLGGATKANVDLFTIYEEYLADARELNRQRLLVGEANAAIRDFETLDAAGEATEADRTMAEQARRVTARYDGVDEVFEQTMDRIFKVPQDEALRRMQGGKSLADIISYSGEGATPDARARMVDDLDSAIIEQRLAAQTRVTSALVATPEAREAGIDPDDFRLGLADPALKAELRNVLGDERVTEAYLSVNREMDRREEAMRRRAAAEEQYARDYAARDERLVQILQRQQGGPRPEVLRERLESPEFRAQQQQHRQYENLEVFRRIAGAGDMPIAQQDIGRVVEAFNGMDDLIAGIGRTSGIFSRVDPRALEGTLPPIEEPRSMEQVLAARLTGLARDYNIVPMGNYREMSPKEQGRVDDFARLSPEEMERRILSGVPETQRPRAQERVQGVLDEVIGLTGDRRAAAESKMLTELAEFINIIPTKPDTEFGEKLTRSQEKLIEDFSRLSPEEQRQRIVESRTAEDGTVSSVVQKRLAEIDAQLSGSTAREQEAFRERVAARDDYVRQSVEGSATNETIRAEIRQGLVDLSQGVTSPQAERADQLLRSFATERAGSLEGQGDRLRSMVREAAYEAGLEPSEIDRIGVDNIEGLVAALEGKLNPALERTARAVDPAAESVERRRSEVSIERTAGQVRARDAQGNLIGQMKVSDQGEALRIDQAHVEPEARGKGVYTQMLDSLKREALEAGKPIIHGDVVNRDLQRKFQREGLLDVSSMSTQEDTPSYMRTVEMLQAEQQGMASSAGDAAAALAELAAVARGDAKEAVREGPYQPGDRDLSRAPAYVDDGKRLRIPSTDSGVLETLDFLVGGKKLPGFSRYSADKLIDKGSELIGVESGQASEVRNRLGLMAGGDFLKFVSPEMLQTHLGMTKEQARATGIDSVGGQRKITAELVEAASQGRDAMARQISDTRDVEGARVRSREGQVNEQIIQVLSALEQAIVGLNECCKNMQAGGPVGAGAGREARVFDGEMRAKARPVDENVRKDVIGRLGQPIAQAIAEGDLTDAVMQVLADPQLGRKVTAQQATSLVTGIAGDQGVEFSRTAERAAISAGRAQQIAAQKFMGAGGDEAYMAFQAGDFQEAAQALVRAGLDVEGAMKLIKSGFDLTSDEITNTTARLTEYREELKQQGQEVTLSASERRALDKEATRSQRGIGLSDQFNPEDQSFDAAMRVGEDLMATGGLSGQLRDAASAYREVTAVFPNLKTAEQERLRSLLMEQEQLQKTAEAQRRFSALKQALGGEDPSNLTGEQMVERMNSRVVGSVNATPTTMRGLEAVARGEENIDPTARRAADNFIGTFQQTLGSSQAMGQGMAAMFQGNKPFLQQVFRLVGVYGARFIAGGMVFGLAFRIKSLVSSGLEAEQTFVRISGALDATQKAAGGVKKELQDIALRTNVTLTDTYNTMANLVGVFDTTEDALVATEIVAQLEIISQGALSAEDAYRSLNAVINGFYDQLADTRGLQGADALSYIADIATRLQELRSVNIEDTLEGLGRLGEPTKQLGVELEMVAVLLGNVVKGTGQTGQAASEQLGRVLAKFQDANIQDMLVNFGLTDQATIRAGDYQTVFEDIFKNMENLTQEQQGAFNRALGGQRQFATVAAAFGQGAKSIETYQNLLGATGSAAERTEQILGTLRGQIKNVGLQIENIVKNLIDLGILNALGAIVMAFKPLLQITGNILQVMNDFKNVNPFAKWIINIGMLVAGFKVLSGLAGGIAMIAGRSLGLGTTATIGQVGSTALNMARQNRAARRGAASSPMLGPYAFQAPGRADPGGIGARAAARGGVPLAVMRNAERASIRLNSALLNTGNRIAQTSAKMGAMGGAVHRLGVAVGNLGPAAAAATMGVGRFAANMVMSLGKLVSPAITLALALSMLDAAFGKSAREAKEYTDQLAERLGRDARAGETTEEEEERTRREQQEEDMRNITEFRRGGRWGTFRGAGEYLTSSPANFGRGLWNHTLGGMMNSAARVGPWDGGEAFLFGDQIAAGAGVVPDELQSELDNRLQTILAIRQRFQQEGGDPEEAAEGLNEIMDWMATEAVDAANALPTTAQRYQALQQIENLMGLNEAVLSAANAAALGLGDVMMLSLAQIGNLVNQYQFLSGLSNSVRAEFGAAIAESTAAINLPEEAKQQLSGLAEANIDPLARLERQSDIIGVGIDEARRELQDALDSGVQERIDEANQALQNLLGIRAQVDQEIIATLTDLPKAEADLAFRMGNYEEAARKLRDTAAGYRRAATEAGPGTLGEAQALAQSLDAERGAVDAELAPLIQGLELLGAQTRDPMEKLGFELERLNAMAQAAVANPQAFSAEDMNKLAVETAGLMQQLADEQERATAAVAQLRINATENPMEQAEIEYAEAMRGYERAIAEGMGAAAIAEAAGRVQTAAKRIADERRNIVQAVNRLRQAQTGNPLEKAALEREQAMLEYARAINENLGAAAIAEAAAAAEDAARSERSAIEDLRKSRASLSMARLPQGDELLVAMRELDESFNQQAFAAREFGRNSSEYVQATIDVINRQKDVADAIQASVDAQTAVAVALASAAGLDIEAARIGMEAAKNEYERALREAGGNRNAASVQQAAAEVINQEASFRDTVLSEALETISFMRDMEEITANQAIAALREILATMDLTEKQKRDIRRQIKGLEDELSSSLAGGFNIADIRLPTPYEVRRSIAESPIVKGIKEGKDEIDRLFQQAQDAVEADAGVVGSVLNRVLGDELANEVRTVGDNTSAMLPPLSEVPRVVRETIANREALLAQSEKQLASLTALREQSVNSINQLRATLSVPASLIAERGLRANELASLQNDLIKTSNSHLEALIRNTQDMRTNINVNVEAAIGQAMDAIINEVMRQLDAEVRNSTRRAGGGGGVSRVR